MALICKYSKEYWQPLSSSDKTNIPEHTIWMKSLIAFRLSGNERFLFMK